MLLKRWLEVAPIVLAGVVAWLWVAGASIGWDVAANSMSPDSGHAYIAPVKVSSLWIFEADHEGAGAASALTLFEDGRALGPAHVQHSEIRATGEGRYSHWNQAIWFSSSDNSDPRSNGRHYVAKAPIRLDGRIGAGLICLFLLPALARLGLRFRSHMAGRMKNGALALGATLFAPGLMEAAQPLTTGTSWLSGCG